MDIQLFIPCFVDQFYPEVGHNIVKILNKSDIGIEYNPEQTCCGQIAFNTGRWKEATKMAKKFLTTFNDNVPIVTPSASCASYLKNYYSKLFSVDSEEFQHFTKMKEHLFELSDFLFNHIEGFSTEAKFYHTVTYHDSCSGLREYKLGNEARELLKKVEGLQLIEMDNTLECCGFGGTFAVKHKYISQAMVQQKVENAIKTGAEFITSTEVSCLMNIESYIKKQKLPLKVVHFSEILVSGW